MVATGRKASPITSAAIAGTSITYRVSCPRNRPDKISPRPSSTGRQSTTMIQPARMAQARQARSLPQMLTRMTAAVTATATQARAGGGLATP